MKRQHLFVFGLMLVMVAVLTQASLGMPADAAQVVAVHASAPLLQFNSGGHDIGFDRDGIYVGSGTHAVRVEFANALPTAPMNSSSVSQSAGNDPVLTWNTFLGGNGDDGSKAIAVDTNGNVYVVGASTATWGSPKRAFSGGSSDAYVAKLDANGNLQWNTFLGGNAMDGGRAIAVDGGGNVYVAGESWSTWGSPKRPFSGGYDDGYVAKLDADGNLIWNTFLGGSGWDECWSIAADGNGNSYCSGYSYSSWGSPTLPFSGGGDAFAAKLDSLGNLTWHSFIGGSGWDRAFDVAADASGNSFITGESAGAWGSPKHGFSGGSRDSFVAKLDSTGHLTWNTFLGGSGNDYGYGIAADGSEDVYIAGVSGATWGSPKRLFSGSSFDDAFAAKLDDSGNLIWNTFLGGSVGDEGQAIAVDGSGNIFVAGDGDGTWGTPIRPYTGACDAFVVRLDDSGNLIWNTFLGSSGNEGGRGIALDSNGNIYATGESTHMWGSPIRAYTAYEDAYVAKLSTNIRLYLPLILR